MCEVAEPPVISTSGGLDDTVSLICTTGDDVIFVLWYSLPGRLAWRIKPDDQDRVVFGMRLPNRLETFHGCTMLYKQLPVQADFQARGSQRLPISNDLLV